MIDPTAAIARLEENMKHMVSSMVDLRKINADQERELRRIVTKLDQSEGGIKVLRWLGFSSLGGALAAIGAFFVWFKGL